MNSTANPFASFQPSQLPINTFSQWKEPFTTPFDLLSSTEESNEILPQTSPMCSNCKEKVKQPCICPNCSKTTCGLCIKEWIVDQKLQCPDCLYPLKISQLISRKHKSEPNPVPIERASTPPNEDNICANHNVQRSYHCMTCITPICAECAMFDNQHQNHKFEYTEKVYEQKIGKIRSALDTLSQQSEKLTYQLVLLEESMVIVEKNKERRAQELHNIRDQITKRLETNMKSKVISLTNQKSAIIEDLKLLEQTHEEISTQIDNCSKDMLISDSENILNKIREFNDKISKVAEGSSVSLDFPSEITPQFEPIIFQLKHYSLLKHYEVVYSEPFSMNGLKWRLKVYPQGKGATKGTYLSVFLEMIEDLGSPARYEYKIELINQRDQKDGSKLSKEFVSEFSAGQCWGYSNFIKISDLEEKGYLVPEQDTLEFRYAVRTQTYHQQCQDQQKYITHLEEKQKNSEAMIAELQKRLAQEVEEKQKLLHAHSKVLQAVAYHDLLSGEEIKPSNRCKDVNKKVMTPKEPKSAVSTADRDTLVELPSNKTLESEDVVCKTRELRDSKGTFTDLFENDFKAGESSIKIESKGSIVIKEDEPVRPNHVVEVIHAEEKNVCEQFEVVDCVDTSFQNLDDSSVEECPEGEGIDDKANIKEDIKQALADNSKIIENVTNFEDNDITGKTNYLEEDKLKKDNGYLREGQNLFVTFGHGNITIEERSNIPHYPKDLLLHYKHRTEGSHSGI